MEIRFLKKESQEIDETISKIIKVCEINNLYLLLSDKILFDNVFYQNGIYEFSIWYSNVEDFVFASGSIFNEQLSYDILIDESYSFYILKIEVIYKDIFFTNLEMKLLLDFCIEFLTINNYLIVENVDEKSIYTLNDLITIKEKGYFKNWNHIKNEEST